MDVLVVDIGGSHVKMLASGAAAPRHFPSSADMTPRAAIPRVLELTRDWSYDVIALGYPGAVDATGPTGEPGNLGSGWVGFDYAAAFGKPVRVVNDAVLQALGAYDGGRMLFLGLGTGLGSALISEHVVVPLELGGLPFDSDSTFADRIGRAGLSASGGLAWNQAVARVTAILRIAFAADYIVVGGGNAKHLDPLPPFTRRGHNRDAFTGGFRLWEDIVEPHDRTPSQAWRVLR